AVILSILASLALCCNAALADAVTVRGHIVSSRSALASGNIVLHVRHLPMATSKDAAQSDARYRQHQQHAGVPREDSVHVRPDGSFALVNMEHGSHIVEIECTSTADECPLYGSSLRIDVNRNSGRV